MGSKIEVIACRNVYYGGTTKTVDPASGLERVIDHNKLYLEGQRLFIDEDHFTDADKAMQRKDATGRPVGPKVYGSYRRVHPEPLVVPVAAKETANAPVPMSEIVPQKAKAAK